MNTANNSNNHTAIFFGSPNNRGNTYRLLDAVLRHCPEDASADLICAYDLQIKPCYGCDSCKTLGRCVRNSRDDFSKIERILRRSNTIIIASPVYFQGFPAPLKQLFDRFQPYFYTKPFQNKPVRRALLLTTSGSGDSTGTTCLSESARRVLDTINATLVSTVSAQNTDHPWEPDLSRCSEAAELLFQP